MLRTFAFLAFVTLLLSVQGESVEDSEAVHFQERFPKLFPVYQFNQARYSSEEDARIAEKLTRNKREEISDDENKPIITQKVNFEDGNLKNSSELNIKTENSDLTIKIKDDTVEAEYTKTLKNDEEHLLTASFKGTGVNNSEVISSASNLEYTDKTSGSKFSTTFETQTNDTKTINAKISKPVYDDDKHSVNVGAEINAHINKSDITTTGKGGANYNYKPLDANLGFDVEAGNSKTIINTNAESKLFENDDHVLKGNLGSKHTFPRGEKSIHEVNANLDYLHRPTDIGINAGVKVGDNVESKIESTQKVYEKDGVVVELKEHITHNSALPGGEGVGGGAGVNVKVNDNQHVEISGEKTPGVGPALNAKYGVKPSPSTSLDFITKISEKEKFVGVEFEHKFGGGSPGPARRTHSRPTFSVDRFPDRLSEMRRNQAMTDKLFKPTSRHDDFKISSSPSFSSFPSSSRSSVYSPLFGNVGSSDFSRPIPSLPRLDFGNTNRFPGNAGGFNLFPQSSMGSMWG